MRYQEDDWVKYRHHEGWVTKGKILEERPDGVLIVGSHGNDPEPDYVNPDDIIEKM